MCGPVAGDFTHNKKKYHPLKNLFESDRDATKYVLLTYFKLYNSNHQIPLFPS